MVRSFSIPVVDSKGYLDVSVKFAVELKCKALFDTGATITGIAPHIIKQVGGVFKEERDIVGVQNTRAKIYKVMIGVDFQKHKHTAVVNVFALDNSKHIGVDVLLGMNVIQTFQSACIDKYGKEIVIKVEE